jgi:hypothetical protein
MRSDEKFEASFRKPNPIDRAVNRAFGFLVGLGFGLSHNYLLQVRGRKTGRLYSTPINLLEFKDKRFLVAPRGRTTRFGLWGLRRLRGISPVHLR